MILHQSFHWFLTGLVFPVLSLFILDRGMDYLQLGSLMAIGSAAVIAAELPTGGLADTIGRKRVYLASLFFSAGGILSLLFSSSFPGLAFGFLLTGMGRALSSGSMEAYFIDGLYREKPDRDIQPCLAVLNAAIPLSLGAASLIGGFLPEAARRLPVGLQPGNIYSINLAAVLIFTVLQFLMTLLLIREEVPHRPARFREGFRQVPTLIGSSFRFALGSRTVLLILLAGLAWGFSVSGLEQYWQPRVRSILRGTEQTRIFGYLGFGYFLASTLGSLASTGLCRLFRGSYSTALCVFRAVMGALFLILTAQTSLAGFSLLYLLTFSANGAANSPEDALFNSAVPSERRSTMLSFSSLFMQSGGLLGSLILGFTAETRSITAAWILAGGLLLVSSVLYLMISAPERRAAHGI